MNVRDLLIQTLSSVQRIPADTGPRATLLPSANLGRIEGDPTPARQALALLLRGALRVANQARFILQAERFTDDSTDQDWVEISVQSPVRVPALRHKEVEISVQRAGGRLELETAPGAEGCVYRIYLPCTPVLVPFPAYRQASALA